MAATSLFASRKTLVNHDLNSDLTLYSPDGKKCTFRFLRACSVSVNYYILSTYKNADFLISAVKFLTPLGRNSY